MRPLDRSLLLAASLLVALAPPLAAAPFSLHHEPEVVAQGGWIRVQALGPPDLPRPEGTFAGKALRFYRGVSLGSWEALAGADLNLSNGKGRLEVRVGGEVQEANVRVVSGKYPVERLTLPPGKVNPTRPEVLARIRKDRARAKKAGMVNRDYPFTPVLTIPCKGRLSSSFGKRRILNGTPKSPHGGTDIAAVTGTPVHAAAPGVVRLVDDMFYSGKTLFLDHGSGWMTTYMHLSEILVEEGASVSRGQLVAKVGATGRVTGPHLHWGLQWLRSRVDPLSMVADPPAENSR